jgi:hypothetical protein
LRIIHTNLLAVWRINRVASRPLADEMLVARPRWWFFPNLPRKHLTLVLLCCRRLYLLLGHAGVVTGVSCEPRSCRLVVPPPSRAAEVAALPPRRSSSVELHPAAMGEAQPVIRGFRPRPLATVSEESDAAGFR